MVGLGLFRKRLRDEKLVSLALLAILFATELVAAAAPRLLADASDRSLRTQIAAASTRQRNFQLLESGRVPEVAASGFAALQDRGAVLESALPEALKTIIGSRSIVAETALWQVDAGSAAAYVTLRVQDGVESHISMVAGTMPGATVGTAPYGSSGVEAGTTVPSFEAAISAPAAAKMGLSVGSSLAITAFTNDPRSPEHSVSVVVRLSGVYRPNDAEDGFWIDDEAVLHSLVYNPSVNREYDQAALLVSPLVLGALEADSAEAALPFNYSWRFYLNPDLLTGGAADRLVAAMRRAEALYPPGTVPVVRDVPAPLGTGSGPQPIYVEPTPSGVASSPPGGAATPAEPKYPAALSSGLLALLLGHLQEWQIAYGILTIAATGTAAVVVAMVWLLVSLASAGRRRAAIISRRRGAPAGVILAGAIAEAVVLSIPPAALALFAAVVALPGPGVAESFAACGFVAVVAMIALVAAALGRGFSGGGSSTADLDRPGAAGASAVGLAAAGDGSGARTASRYRRAALEISVIAAAVGAALLLRERGLIPPAVGSGSANGDPAGPDLLVEALPALLGAAAGIVVVRLYPAAMRLAAAVAGRGRGLLPAMALRHAARGSGAAATLLVLMAAISSGTFAASVVGSLGAAQDAVAWQRVGAPFRIESSIGPLSAGLDPASWPGVSAAAPASVHTISLSTGGFRTLETVDVKAYESVVTGTPADPFLPPDLFGVAGGSLPAVISSSAPRSSDGLSVGDDFTAPFGLDQVRFHVVAVRDSFPGLPAGEPFVIVSRRQFEAAYPADLPAVTMYFLLAPDDAADSMRAHLGELASTVTVESRAEVLAGLEGSPIAGALAAGMAALAIAAVICAALAIAAALALVALARSLETAHLRTLGVTPGQSAALMVGEFGPVVATALAAGIALGYGFFLYLRPGLALGTIVGTQLATAPAVALPQLAMLVAASVAAAALAVGLASANARSAAPATAIRRGME